MKVTTAIRQDKRWKRKNSSEFPVAIRVTYLRKPIFFHFGVDLTEKDFSKVFDPRVREELAASRAIIETRHEEAKEIIKGLDPFSFDSFRKEFYRTKPRRKQKSKPEKSAKLVAPAPFDSTPVIENSEIVISKKNLRNQYGKQKYPKIKSKIDYAALGQVAEVYGSEIIKCELQKRTGNLTNLFNSLISILSFKKNLKFKEITSFFLEQYQAWMEAKGNSVSTIGFYLRPLRTVFNSAIDKGIVKEQLYPFGRRRYIIPTTENVKKAVCTESLRKLYYHVPQCRQEEMYRDFWFFIYFGNGMNLKDVACLKYSKIEGDFIYFIRAKTERTAKGKRKKIQVYLNEDMRRIIDKWGNADKSPENYIFPILRQGLGHYQIRDLVQLFIKRINYWMDVIARYEEIPEEILTMAGRHAFATQLKNSNVNKEFIREALGHIDPDSIDHYFAKFQNVSHVQFVSNLETFKNEKSNIQSDNDRIEILLLELSKLLNKKTENHEILS